MKVWQKLVLIGLAFSMPIAVLLTFLVKGIEKDIQFGTWEKLGNEYQRPLMRLLDHLSQHRLLAMPQEFDRLQEVAAYGEDVLPRGNLSRDERVQISVYAALLKQSDLDRVNGSMQTALTEDKNFYGVSPSFQRNMPPVIRENT